MVLLSLSHSFSLLSLPNVPKPLLKISVNSFISLSLFLSFPFSFVLLSFSPSPSLLRFPSLSNFPEFKLGLPLRPLALSFSRIFLCLEIRFLHHSLLLFSLSLPHFLSLNITLFFSRTFNVSSPSSSLLHPLPLAPRSGLQRIRFIGTYLKKGHSTNPKNYRIKQHEPR